VFKKNNNKIMLEHKNNKIKKFFNSFKMHVIHSNKILFNSYCVIYDDSIKNVIKITTTAENVIDSKYINFCINSLHTLSFLEIIIITSLFIGFMRGILFMWR
jgi:hypothetical protein